MKSSAEASGAERSEPGSDAGAEPDSPKRAIDVTVTTLPGVRHPVDQHWLLRRLAAAAPQLRRPVDRVAVLVVDDRRMADLHQRFMGINETTDVLTFPAEAGAGGIDVDIAVCADEAARQVQHHGHPLDRELLLYALHGMLHCAGFDDVDDDAFEAMHAEEDRILAAIGEPPTFAPLRERRP